MTQFPPHKNLVDTTKNGGIMEVKMELIQKTVRYVLEIYEPMRVDELWMRFESPSPFMAIQAGQVINPGLWPGSKAPQKMLRVLHVEHTIFEIENRITHQTMVFTEEIDCIRDLQVLRYS